MVLKQLVEKHLPPIRPSPGQAMPEFRAGFYAQLEPFRKELEQANYDLREEFPSLFEVVSEKFPQANTNRAHYLAFAALVESIARDWLAKKTLEKPEHRRALLKHFDDYIGPVPDEEIATSLAKELGKQTAVEALKKMSEEGFGVSRFIDAFKCHESKKEVHGLLRDRFNNALGPLISFSQIIRRLLEKT